jgi:hypothetical protein
MPYMRRIETGQKFPNGIKLTRGTCTQCEHHGESARARLMIMGMRKDCVLCAECFADFACVPEGMPCVMYVECDDGRFHGIGTASVAVVDGISKYGQEAEIRRAPEPTEEERRAGELARALFGRR